MENNMVKDSRLLPEDCVAKVEAYFTKHFPTYNLEKKITYTGYWWIAYSFNQNDRLIFEGDIGGHFKVIVFINGSENHLWSYDRTVNDHTMSSDANIQYQLDVLKRFLA